MSEMYSQRYRPFDSECLGDDKDVVVSEEYTSITDDAFAGNDCVVSVRIDTLFEELEYGSFKSCKNLEQINIPHTVKEISHWVFSGCKKLKEIKLPIMLSSIGDSAFRSCGTLSEIAIPASTKSIGASAFKLCKKLETAYIPPSVKKIGKEAFANCPNLTIVTTKGSSAEKYAEKENIPVRLITAAELEDQIKRVNLNGEEIDIMDLQFKLAQKLGHAAMLQKESGRVLMKNQLVYDPEEDDCDPNTIPEFYPQSEDTCYVLGRETIERKAAEYSKEGIDIAHGYITYDKEKMHIATDEEAQKLFCGFETICCACKNPEFLDWLYDFLPKKKNGTLHVGRKAILAKLPLFYHRRYSSVRLRNDMSSSYSYNLIAKVESETEVAIGIESADLMSQPHEDAYKFSVSSPVLPFEEMLDKAARYV